MAPILLGRVGNVVEEVDTDDAPQGDEPIVGHEDTPDGIDADVEDVADVDVEVEEDIFVEDAGVDGAIQSWTAAAEILEARLPPLGLCGTTLAT